MDTVDYVYEWHPNGIGQPVRRVCHTAYQMTRENRSPQLWPQWLREACDKKRHMMGALYHSVEGDPTCPLLLMVRDRQERRTVPVLVDWGDWLVLGFTIVERVPDTTFKATYLKVTP